jgi:hypothetical protein
MSEKSDKIREQILKPKKRDYALFDPDLTSKQWYPGLNPFFAVRIDPKNRYDIWEVFSDLIGYEDEVMKLVRYDRKKFEIETMSKNPCNPQTAFYQAGGDR